MRGRITSLGGRNEASTVRQVEHGVGYGLLLYALVRIFLVETVFGDHGVNVVLFAVIELGTAFPYGVALARTVRLLATGSFARAAGPGVVAAACFSAPYAYVLVAVGSDAPPVSLTAVWVVFAVALAAATIGAARSVQRYRRNSAVRADR